MGAPKGTALSSARTRRRRVEPERGPAASRAMDASGEPGVSGDPDIPGRRRYVPFFRRTTTLAAGAVLTAAAIAAVVIGDRGSSGGPVAAHVGPAVISGKAVQREVAAIQSLPTYEAALSQASTPALAAPVSPKAVAAADGDPDDLRISFSASGTTATRAYTATDLRADVLTRQIYVVALDRLLSARHVKITGAELADARAAAVLDSGTDDSGANLFTQLPGWYQSELVRRGAAIEALEAADGGDGVTSVAITANYQQRRTTDFTVVCLRSVVVAPDGVAAGRGALARGKQTAAGGNGTSGGSAPAGAGVRNDGCATLSGWATDVAAAVRSTPVGATASVERKGRVALLEVTSRRQLPLAQVEPSIRAGLASAATDQVNTMVDNELALLRVTVAPEYGTFEDMGGVEEVLAPDALTPPPSTPVGPKAPPATSPPQRPDPFD